MTRQDYILLAEVIREATSTFAGKSAKHVFIGLLGSKLKEDNSRFDTTRFQTACNTEKD